ncbi:MAG: hypothetical protein Q4G07_01760 [Oscillospiraceae bacterium]|nr:hypothetical protein [Oscillospiraceae bacterium]
MFCLWDTAAYKHIHTVDEWEKVFSGRRAFEKEIAAHRLAPIYFYGFGWYRFCVCPAGQINLQDMESPLISEPYLLHVKGDLCLCGIEYIGSHSQYFHRMLLKAAPGAYSITAVLPQKSQGTRQQDFCDVLLLLQKPRLHEKYRLYPSTFYPLDNQD